MVPFERKVDIDQLSVDLDLAQRCGPDAVRILRQIEKAAQSLETLVSSLPRVFSHGDLVRRNLAKTIRGSQQIIKAIDWSGVGVAAVGVDLAALIGASMQFDVQPVKSLDLLDRTVVEAYHRRLDGPVGRITLRDVDTGYRASTGLRLLRRAASISHGLRTARMDNIDPPRDLIEFADRFVALLGSQTAVVRTLL